MLRPSFRRSIGACAVALLAAGTLRGADAPSRWSLEGRLLIGPSRERHDGTREAVRYASIGFARRLGPTSAWRTEP